MADVRPVQSPHGVRVALAVVVYGFIVGVSALPLLEPVGTDATHRAIKFSARMPILFWCLGWLAVIVRHPDRPIDGQLWALGCALLWVHVAIAFHLGHGWSHAAAWEHTKQVGGYGDGVFVNYAFALVWLLDALWVLVASASYQARPRWLHWAVHGFLAFVVFNAAFVFAKWDTRTLFLLCSSLGALALWCARRHAAEKSGV
ncbi:MAG: hypothetical protein FJ304_20340 [Planctomycetes bacterium]|nr:hypothetical protein [Planctomycetota bacterium]